MLIFVIEESNNNELKFIEFGKPYKNQARSWGPGVREYYMVHLITGGEGYLNGQHLKEGQYFITKPYQRIKYYPSEKNPWDYVWILVKGDKVEEFLESFGFDARAGYGFYEGKEQVERISSTLFAKDYDIVNQVTAKNLAKLLLSYNEKHPIEKNLSIKQKHLKKATEFIDSKYHEGISPKTVAQFVGLDEKYLYSIFKANLKMSVQEYLDKVRIKKAKILLEKSDLNISEIAYSVGIDDPLNFSKFFKKIVGESPRAYREKL